MPSTKANRKAQKLFPFVKTDRKTGRYIHIPESTDLKTDGFFTTDVSYSFLSPLEKIP